MNQSLGEKGRQTFQRTQTSFKSRDLKLEILSSMLITLYLKHRPIENLMFIIHMHESIEIHTF